jgi:hypothetical protein
MDVTPKKLYTSKGIQFFHFTALIYDTVHRIILMNVVYKALLNAAISSGFSLTDNAETASSRWLILVEPIIGAVTSSFCSNHASAISIEQSKSAIGFHEKTCFTALITPHSSLSFTLRRRGCLSLWPQVL